MMNAKLGGEIAEGYSLGNLINIVNRNAGSKLERSRIASKFGGKFISSGGKETDPSFPLDLQPIIEAALHAVDASRIAPGIHSRWIGAERENQAGGARPNPYGCADAANILYTVGHFPMAEAERKPMIEVLQSFQNRETGLFEEPTHHTYHVTAHCAGALELFDQRPSHSMQALSFLDEDGALERFLDELPWQDLPTKASHRGAAVFAARVLCGEATPDWQDRYFNWLWKRQDPETGLLLRESVVGCQGEALFLHLVGTFHYLFNHEHARRPLRYPAALVDTCLALRKDVTKLGRRVSFWEIDWVYCLSRARRQCGHRFSETQDELQIFAREYAGFLLRLVSREALPFTDLHSLFGALCALAEIQAALPGVYRTKHPLRLVLDRRPFI